MNDLPFCIQYSVRAGSVILSALGSFQLFSGMADDLGPKRMWHFGQIRFKRENVNPLFRPFAQIGAV